MYSFFSDNTKPYYLLKCSDSLNNELSPVLVSLCLEIEEKKKNYNLFAQSYFSLLSATLIRNNIFTDNYYNTNKASLKK